jgi:hypothetical protein
MKTIEQLLEESKIFPSSEYNDLVYAATPEEIRRFAALVRSQALDEAAEVCDGFIDAKEQARAALAAAKALEEGSVRDQIDRLSHEGTVNLYNRALERCADAIRALKGNGSPAQQTAKGE